VLKQGCESMRILCAFLAKFRSSDNVIHSVMSRLGARWLQTEYSSAVFLQLLLSLLLLLFVVCLL